VTDETEHERYSAHHSPRRWRCRGRTRYRHGPSRRKEINHQRAKLDADMDDVQARLARGPNTARERRILKRRRVSLRAKLRDPKNKSLKMWEYDVHQIAGHA
jgi:hypothetical protein